MKYPDIVMGLNVNRRYQLSLGRQRVTDDLLIIQDKPYILPGDTKMGQTTFIPWQFYLIRYSSFRSYNPECEFLKGIGPDFIYIFVPDHIIKLQITRVILKIVQSLCPHRMIKM